MAALNTLLSLRSCDYLFESGTLGPPNSVKKVSENSKSSSETE